MYSKHISFKYILFAVAVGIFTGCQAPTVNAGEDVTIKEGEVATLKCEASDRYGLKLTYKWLKDDKLLSNTSSYTTPEDLSVGRYSYVCEASNGQASATDSVVVTVEESDESDSNKKYGLLKTGQSESYADYDDGYYQKGLERNFVRDDEKEVVIDNTQQLMWQDDGKNFKLDYDALKEKSGYKRIPDYALHHIYCKNLELGGYNNWRYPTKDELISLINFGNKQMYEDVFQNINPNKHYLTTYIESYWGRRLAISLKDFDAQFVPEWALPSFTTPLCVRSMSDKKPLKNVHNFVRDDNLSVVIDKDLNLMWQDDKESVDVELNWEDANRYCKNLELSGYNDWRLPNATEIATIFALAGYENKTALVRYFINVKQIKRTNGHLDVAHYWTSTTLPDNSDKVFTLDCYRSGYSKGIANSNKDNTLNVKCVRDN